MSARHLLVFDGPGILDTVQSWAIDPGDEVEIFPLTGVEETTARLEAELTGMGLTCSRPDISGLLASAAETSREWYLSFSASLANLTCPDGSPLAAFFAVDESVSAWWLSVISDKNPFKSRTINQLVQLEAVAQHILGRGFRSLAVHSSDSPLAECLAGLAGGRGLDFRDLAGTADAPAPRPWREHVRHLGSVARSLRNFYHSIHRHFPEEPDPGAEPVDLVLMTYYPNHNQSLAKAETYRDGFYRELQPALEQSGVNLAWLACYVPHAHIPFEKVVEQAHLHREAGSPLHFLYGFFEPGMIGRGMKEMIRLGRRFLTIESHLAGLHVRGDYPVYPLFRGDWTTSFLGYAGLEGLLLTWMYRAALAKLKPRQCLFLYEGNSHEKSIILARNSLGRDTRLLGYQCGAVSPMYLPYLLGPGQGLGMGGHRPPLPDVLLCNGPAPVEVLSRWNWPSGKLKIVEAVRQYSLRESLEWPAAEKRNVLLVLFSISLMEAKAHLRMVMEAFPEGCGVDVWFKPHPYMPVDELFRVAGLARETFPHRFVQGPVEPFLRQAKVVVGGETSVVIQALVGGCRVLNPLTPEWFNMSPCQDWTFPGVSLVGSARELRRKAEAIFAESDGPPPSKTERARILDFFFHLPSPGSPPVRFLEALGLGARIQAGHGASTPFSQ